MKNGFFIAVEGIDGSGKSTFIKALGAELSKANIANLVTKQPGATPLGHLLREIIMKKEVPINSQAEFLMFAADRSQQVEDIIKPALDKGEIVLCDRTGDSSLVYQGYVRGLNTDMISTVNSWVMQGVTPSLTFYVQLDVQTAFDRVFKRQEELTQFEKEKEGFMQKVKDGFEDLYKNNQNVVYLDGNLSTDTLVQQAFEKIKQLYE